MSKDSHSPRSGGHGDAQVRGDRSAQPTADTDESQAPPGLDLRRNARMQELAQQAEHLRNNLIPVMMSQIVGCERSFEPAGFETYLARLMDDAGNPSDPVERMLLEQLAMAHFRIAQLHIKANDAKSADLAKVYNSSASRLLGEFRRVALAISTYRGQAPKSKPKQKLGVVKAAS